MLAIYFHIYLSHGVAEDPYFVTIPIKDKSKPKGHRTTLRCPVLLPHEILHHMAHTGQATVSKEEIVEYWNHWNRYKPRHLCSDSKNHTPLGMAGDDARYTLAGSKVIIICLSNLLWDRRCRSNQKSDLNVDSLWVILAGL